MHARDLRELAERWIASKNTAKPSPNTVLARRYDLCAIADPLSGRAADDNSGSRHTDLTALAALTPTDLTVSRLEDAIAQYAESHAASSTRRLMSTWRQFCLWLLREGELSTNPLDVIEGPRRDPWRPKPLHTADLEAVATTAAAASPVSRQPWPQRDEALFAVLITAGARVSEVIALRAGDAYLDSDPPRLRITGKGGRTRAVPLPPETVDVIASYLQDRAERLGSANATDPLLVRPDGRPLTRSAVDHAVRGWFRRAGRTPPPGALVHSFRHTYATMLIDNGASLPEVQQLLGHADLGTTQAYLGVTAKGLEDAALANPARRLLRP